MARRNVKIKGAAISPGFGEGKVYVIKEFTNFTVENIQIDLSQIEDEHLRIQKAFSSVIRDLSESADHVGKMIDESFAEIFNAQITMLKDPILLEEARSLLEKELISAEKTVIKVFSLFAERMKRNDNLSLRDKADDLADLSKRVINKLTNKTFRRFSNIPPESVLITDRLLPSDAIDLPRSNINGIVLEMGGAASHGAILTREMGIPAVSEVSDIRILVKRSDHILVDGNDGIVFINPDDDCCYSYKERKMHYSMKRKRAALRAGECALTVDGKRIPVFANIGDKNDAFLAAENGADGIGLFRIEQIYLSLDQLPDSHYLADRIAEVLQPIKKLSVNIRLLDTGNDKQIPFLSYPEEANPALGLRGIRFLLKYPDMLNEQLKAFLHIARSFDISILVPMVTSVNDIVELKRELRKCAEELSADRIPRLGAMIETPAAALLASEIAQQVDYLSIGTNDLTQYTMACGRENHLVADYYVDAHPAVMKLITLMIDSLNNKKVSLCGELASQLESIPLLLRTGIEALSVNPLQIPMVKETIRDVTLSAAE